MNLLYHHRTRGADVEGVHIRGVVSALRTLGHRVDLVSPPGTQPPAPPASPSRWSRFAGAAPELLFEGFELAYNAYAARSLATRLRRGHHRLIYERYALFLLAGVISARRRHVPLILEVNDSALLDRVRPLRLAAAARRIERFVWRSADAILTISDYFRDLIVEAGVAPERVHVRPNAVDEGEFSSPPDGAPVTARLGLAGKRVIGYVGAINRWRRLDLLLASFAELARERPDLHLLVVGDGPDRAALEEQICAEQLVPRVTFTGAIPHRDIGAHLAAVDVAVLPHSNDYGSPMKLFEYMASGRAIVAPWLPPIVSVIGDGDGATLFRPLDRSALARAIGDLLEDPSRRRALGQRARERALGEFVWRRHAETILAIHARLEEEHR